MTENRQIVDFEDAVLMLPNSKMVHVFRNPAASMLVGADWHYDDVVNTMKRNKVELSGPMATGMGHGLCLNDGSGWIFIETRKTEGEK